MNVSWHLILHWIENTGLEVAEDRPALNATLVNNIQLFQLFMLLKHTEKFWHKQLIVITRETTHILV